MRQHQSGSGGGGRAGGGGEGGGGSQREFNPPEFAEHAVDAITALVARSRHAPSAHDQAVRMMRHGGGLRRGVPGRAEHTTPGCTYRYDFRQNVVWPNQLTTMALGPLPLCRLS